MVPEKGNEKSGTALAALVRALQNKQSVALILFLPRVSEKTGGNPTVCAGTPVLVSLAAPLGHCWTTYRLCCENNLGHDHHLHVPVSKVLVVLAASWTSSQESLLLECLSSGVIARTLDRGKYVQGNGAGPDHLVLNHLPFAEDLRVAKFTSFEERQDLLPTAQQVESMNDLVKGLSLQSGKYHPFVT